LSYLKLIIIFTISSFIAAILKREVNLGREWWYISVIQVLRRHKLGGCWFKANLGKNLVKPPSQQISQAWWFKTLILSTWEVP
jgi:hypothetical protein